ncbi:MAG TPA: ornithine carbamoyltransferase [Rugosimonospora sp.]|nr:ornithine carbamoyltransferase [Rugosimonospora sp.]
MTTGRGLLRIADLDTAELRALVDRSCQLCRNPADHGAPLSGTAVGILFTQTSTRTRTAFTVGSIRLGGTPVGYGPTELQTNTGETLADTGAVLGGMLDLLVIRTNGTTGDLAVVAGGGAAPVINAMTRDEHPTQAISDLATLTLRFGRLDGINLLYVGEGNSTATALAAALARIPGCVAVFLTPPGYGLPGDVLAAARRAARDTGATIVEEHDMEARPAVTDVVYTTRWQTTGTTKPDDRWRELFRPFHVETAFMKCWPTAVFMHDLPAHRGEEVSSEVLDGPSSIAWQQAAMKLPSAMAVLERTAT